VVKPQQQPIVYIETEGNVSPEKRKEGKTVLVKVIISFLIQEIVNEF
jgi:hypothetical protein